MKRQNGHSNENTKVFISYIILIQCVWLVYISAEHNTICLHCWMIHFLYLSHMCDKQIVSLRLRVIFSLFFSNRINRFHIFISLEKVSFDCNDIIASSYCNSLCSRQKTKRRSWLVHVYCLEIYLLFISVMKKERHYQHDMIIISFEDIQW